MPEKEARIPHLNGYDTVRLAAQLSGLPSRLAARRAHEVLYYAGLDEQRYRPVSGYSAGMNQKVKLATALVHDPKILVLDEPTNGLDPKARREMLELISDLTGRFQKSVILSSHILSDVERVCEHVVLMEQGALLASESVHELTRHETRSIHLFVSGDVPASRAALERVDGAAVVESDPGRFLVTVAAELPSSALFGAVRGAGGQVHEFREHRRSLEDVFLGAVRSKRNSSAERDR
jgi:ABC-2 type transport system ATP-binding protein